MKYFQLSSLKMRNVRSSLFSSRSDSGHIADLQHQLSAVENKLLQLKQQEAMAYARLDVARKEQAQVSL